VDQQDPDQADQAADGGIGERVGAQVAAVGRAYLIAFQKCPMSA
jgi:hypothetical protein